MDAIDSARVARELCESKANTFVAITEDGEKKLTAPKTKGRWDRLARLAASLGAVRVECRSEAGEVVAVVVLDDEPARVAPVAVPVAVPQVSQQVAEMAALIRMIGESADKQVERFQAATMATLGSSIKMLEVVTRRVDALEARQETSLRGRERDIEANSLALGEMAASVAQERADVESAITDAMKRESGTDESGPGDAMVARLLEPLAMSIASKMAVG